MLRKISGCSGLNYILTEDTGKIQDPSCSYRYLHNRSAFGQTVTVSSIFRLLVNLVDFPVTVEFVHIQSRISAHHNTGASNLFETRDIRIINLFAQLFCEHLIFTRAISCSADLISVIFPLELVIIIG